MNRSKTLISVDKNISYKILNTKPSESNNRYETFKDVKRKMFKFKLMINELPVIEKLKIRTKNLYRDDLNCIRCNNHIETIEHLWECLMVRNEIVRFEVEMKEWLENIIRSNKKFTSHDTLIDKLYKYTRFSCTLREQNTPENTELHQRLNSYKKRYTYIWDQKGSLDDFVKGWIPLAIVETLKNYYNSNSNESLNDLLYEWSNRTITFIYNLWKQRNKLWKKWELANGITKVEKRKQNRNKNSIRLQRKRIFSGKRPNYYHFVDENFYEKVKIRLGMRINLDFHKRHGKRVGFFCFIIIEIVFVRIDYI